ncbi:endonuclease/exonuclease/phosphatase family protein [Demequina aestuarii]|uniref:endonuclease/exonuclease/phosphatase family protein n=1 Tax=Demequina aestuarii TaxID=327095 RepID=UPI0007829B4C|nr:endonuclease/exonuclease/phosphatase family protein [Demequina aestuarii]
MVSAQRRALFLVAVASWLLLDSVRTAGPLLSALYDDSLTLVVAAAVGTFAGGGVLAWLAAMVGRHFGHGVVVLYLVGVLAVLRLGLPFISGGWLIAAGLYLVAFAIAGVVMAARVALGNGGSGTALAGTSLGAAAAVLEHTVLRTWDAVWREDLQGWIALGTVAVLAIVAGSLCRTLEPAPSSRGWWALGLYWSLLGFAFANVAWVNAQTDLRMSAGVIITVVSLCVAAGLAAQVHRVSPVVTLVIAGAGVVALAFVMTSAGTAAAIALPAATAATALSAAHVLRPAPSTAGRRLLAALVFGLAMIGPVLLIQLDYDMPLPLPPFTVPAVAAGLLFGFGTAHAARARPASTRSPADDASATPSSRVGNAGAPFGWIAPGVPLAAAVGVVAAVGVGAWTHVTYEQPRIYSADFIQAPYVTSWNLHFGVTHEAGGGPRVDLDEVAAALDGTDVAMLQEVQRGSLLGGGTDMLEYLAGELNLPYSYAPAHDRQFGNAIFTSRPHSEPRTLELPFGEGPQQRSALAVDFMGATFVSTHLQSTDEADATRLAQAQELTDWLAGLQPTVVGGDFNAEPGDAAHQAMVDAGFVSAQGELGVTGPTYVGPDLTGEQAALIDYLFGRSVEFTEFELRTLPWSDHWPLTARAATGAVAPTEPEADLNEVQPAPIPSTSASPNASASPTPSESASE